MRDGLPCIAHASDRQLESAAAAGSLVVARGTRIDRTLARRVHDHLPVVAFCNLADRCVVERRLLEADLAGTVFEDDVDFSSMILRGCDFTGATFERTASWRGTLFQETTWFSKATFQQTVWFDGASFADTVVLDDARFEESANFQGVSFKGIQCRNAVFAGTAWFNRAKLEDGDFYRTTFKDRVFVDGATLERIAFSEARFERGGGLGPADVRGTLDLSRSTFFEKVAIELADGQLFCRATRFTRGGSLRLRGSEIVLEDVEFGGPFLLAALEERPRVLSLRGADVANLALASVDLSACRLEGASGLDKLRLEGDTDFASAPGWTRRRALAEEHEWRAHRAQDARWLPAECRLPDWLRLENRNHGIRDAQVLQPRQIAGLYRALRRSRENASDEPGAADFYYGEMEMRKHDASAPLAERAIVWLYWLSAGYGLRASRALASLAVTVLLFAVLLHESGFKGADAGLSFGATLIFAIESTTSLLRGKDHELTATGELLWIALRLLGPVFFGLTLLSLRGRVKR